MDTIRQVMLYTGEDGMWVAECPSLPGANTQGETREEALVNIQEVIKTFIEILKEDGRPIPEENREMVALHILENA